MNISKDSDARARLWVALGNQPGVSAWFTVWSLSRATKSAASEKIKGDKPIAENDSKCADGSPA